MGAARLLAGFFHVPDAAAGRLLRDALEGGADVLVALRGAHLPRSPRHPFHWEERAAMLRAALDEAQAGRVRFVPARDGELPALSQGRERIDVPEAPQGSAFAPALFGGGDIPEGLPRATQHFLRTWWNGAEHQRLREEWAQLQREKKAWSVAPYPVVLVTVDAVVRAAGHVILIRRGRAPGKGLRALPGGFVDPEESVYDAAVRELVEETRFGLDAGRMRAAFRGVQVFDDPWRSQRGRVITHAHYFDLGDGALPAVQGGDDAADAAWVPIAELRGLEAQFMDDHFQILQHFIGAPLKGS